MKMLWTSAPKRRGRAPWSGGGRCSPIFSLLLLLMVGTVVFHLNSSLSAELSLTRLWRTNNSVKTSEGCSVSTDQCYVSYPLQHSFIIDQPDRCGEEKPFLVLMIPVAPRDTEARRIIRSTWARETNVMGRTVTHYFLMGRSRNASETDVLQEQLLQEGRRHGDVLQSDVVDSYNNLTIKTMLMFEWLSSRCPSAAYAMKIDSDIFLNVHRLVRLLVEAPRSLYMTGLVVRGAAVHRNPASKWFLPVSVFPEPVYPPYLQGMGYVFSMDLPRMLLKASMHVRAVYIEDVYVGLCMRYLGLRPTEPPQSSLFQPQKPFWSFGCYWTGVIATLLENSRQLQDVWTVYQGQRTSGC